MSSLGPPSSTPRSMSSRLRSKSVPSESGSAKRSDTDTSTEKPKTRTSQRVGEAIQNKRIKASSAEERHTPKGRTPERQDPDCRKDSLKSNKLIFSEEVDLPNGTRGEGVVVVESELAQPIGAMITSSSFPVAKPQEGRPSDENKIFEYEKPSLKSILPRESKQIFNILEEIQNHLHNSFLPRKKEAVELHTQEARNAYDGHKEKESFPGNREKQKFDLEQKRERPLKKKVNQVQQRFSQAKCQFLQARFQELMLQYLQNPASYNKETAQWALPSVPIQMSEDELKRNQDSLIKRSTMLMRKVKDQQDALHKKANTLQESLRVAEEFYAELHESEEASMKKTSTLYVPSAKEDTDGDTVNVVTDKELQEQQLQQKKLLSRKTDSQILLRQTHTNYSEAHATHDDLLRRVNNIRFPKFFKGNNFTARPKVPAESNCDEVSAEYILEVQTDIPDSDNESQEEDEVLAEIRQEIKFSTNQQISTESKLEDYRDELKTQLDRLSEKSEEPSEISEWYAQMKQMTENLSGISIVTIEHDGLQGSGLKILIELLQRYPLELTLSPRNKDREENEKANDEKDNMESDGEILFISSARLLDGPHLTITGDPSNYEGKNCERNEGNHSATGKVKRPAVHTKSVSLVIPESLPHDLVKCLQGENVLTQCEEIKFVIEETLIRLLAIETRVQNLQELRRKFLTQIDKKGKEVVCTLNEGITVVLSLNCDCPTMRGSTTIQQIVGMSGWDEKELEDIRCEVNRHQRSYGYSPLQIMEDLEHVLKQRQCRQPKTPVNLFLLNRRAG